MIKKNTVALLLIAMIIFTQYCLADGIDPTYPILTKVENLDWLSDDAAKYIDKTDGIWSRKTSAVVVDIKTGIYFNLSRNGGWSHCDSECETKEDTARFKTIIGGKWTKSRNPVLVLIGGKTFAASIYGFPHGGDRIGNNNMGGHVCLHFLNSKLHGADKLDEKHQACVEEALNCSVEDVQDLVKKFYESTVDRE